jgi:hypothetical protein
MNDIESLRLKLMSSEMVTAARKKPPLGLRPWWVVGEHREREIKAAIFRYRMCDVPVPRAWRLEARIWRLLLRWGPGV